MTRNIVSSKSYYYYDYWFMSVCFLPIISSSSKYFYASLCYFLAFSIFCYCSYLLNGPYFNLRYNYFMAGIRMYKALHSIFLSLNKYKTGHDYLLFTMFYYFIFSLFYYFVFLFCVEWTVTFYVLPDFTNKLPVFPIFFIYASNVILKIGILFLSMTLDISEPVSP